LEIFVILRKFRRFKAVFRDEASRIEENTKRGKDAPFQ